MYQGLTPVGWAISRGAWWLGVFGYVGGSVYHSTFAFVTFGLQAAAGAQPAAAPVFQAMLDQFALVFEPVGLLLVGVMAIGFGLIFIATAFRETHYHRWFAVANPLVIPAVTGGLALVPSLELRVFLVVTAYKLSLLAFYAVSTVLLWDHQRPRAAHLRNEASWGPHTRFPRKTRHLTAPRPAETSESKISRPQSHRF